MSTGTRHIPRKLSQVEIVDKVSSVTGKRVVLQPLHVDRSDDVEVTRRSQDVDLKQDSLNGHYLHACKAQKGSHSADNIRVPEPQRAKEQSLPYLSQTRASNNHHNSGVLDAVVE